MTVRVSPDGRSSTYDYGATGTGPSAVELVDRALEKMSKELDPYGSAANLINRWAEHDSSLLPLLPDALQDLEAREKRHLKGRKTKQQGSVVKVGHIALITTLMGPTFYSVSKVITDSAGKVTALSLSELGKDNLAGQPIAIERIAAVFVNILNSQE